MVSPVIGHGTIPGDEQLQWLLRYSYIPSGIDVLFTRAENLRDALILIEKSVTKLNQVYEIYNSKASTDADIHINTPDVSDPGAFADPDETFDPEYYLGNPTGDVATLQGLKDELNLIADALEAAAGGDATLASQIRRLTETIDGVTDTDTLIKWQNNFDPTASGGFNTGTFVVDDPNAVEALAVGNIIRDAVGATQASNERARQDLRSALFTFEEFIKSAGSLMERISRVIEKLATGASGR